MQARNVAAVAGLALMGACSGMGNSCGGCTPAAYDFPSRQAQGSEPVDEGVRLRLTERGLDFLVANFGPILRQQFPADPSAPNSARFPLPSQSFVDSGQSNFGTLNICLEGTTDPPPNGCQPPAQAGLTSAVTLDLAQLESKLTANFIPAPQSGVQLIAKNLYIGLDGRFRTAIQVGPFDTDADCDLHGETTLTAPDGSALPYGTVGVVDLTAEIYPRVSTDPSECQGGAAQCFMASIQVTNAAVHGVGLGVTTPLPCGPSGPVGCSPSCSDVVVSPAVCGSATECYDPFTFSGNIMCPDPVGNCECQLLCPVYGFGADLVGQISDFLLTALQPVLDTLMTAALEQALAQINGQPMALSGQVSAGSLAGAALPSLQEANALGYMVAPGVTTFHVTCPEDGLSSCEVRRGMDVALKTGFEALHRPLEERPAPSPCVPALSGADFLRLYGIPAFEAPDGAPLNGEFTDESGGVHVYDLAASLARASLNQLGWAVFNSGTLCLGVDSYDIHALNGGSLELTAGALDLLTGGRLAQLVPPKAPLYIALAPAEPPVFTMGAGTAADPHLQLALRDMHISIYTLMYERYVRLFDVKTDVTAGLNVNVNPVTRELTVVLAQGPSIANFQQVYNELFPDMDWGSILPTLINVALGALLSQQLQFSFDLSPMLSDALGVPIYVVFEGLQTELAAGQREFLNLYLSMSAVDPNPDVPPLPLPVVPAADVGTWRADAHGRPWATGEARLAAQTGVLPADHRFTYQVDFGPWHDFTAPEADGTLRVQDSKLGLVGRHTVRLKGMRTGQFSTLPPEPTEVAVWTDAQAPQVTLAPAADAVVVTAEDAEAPAQTLAMRWQLEDGAWQGWSAVRTLAAAELRGARRVTVEVRDPAGNVSAPATLVLSTPGVLRAERTENAGSCACVTPPAGVPGAAALLLLLLRVGWRRRR